MRAIVVAALLLAGCGSEPAQKDEPVAKATDATLSLSSPVAQAQNDIETGPVILRCISSDGKTYGVYRIDGAKNTFETWDDVTFNAVGGGRLTVNSARISYLQIDEHVHRLVEISRSTGAIEDSSTYMYDPSSPSYYTFTGTCEVSDHPKPVERKF